MADAKTAAEKAAAAEERAAKAAEKAANKAPEKEEKKVEVILRSRLVWKGRRYKEFDAIEVTELQKQQLEDAGHLASAADLKKLKEGKEIQNQ